MAIISSEVTARVLDEHERDGHDSSWTPRWLQRRRDAEELSRWVSQVVRRWSYGMDGVELADHSTSAGKLRVTVAPEVQSVDPGPPITLLVRMLPAQTISDFQEKADRIAAVMGISAVEITPFDDGFINVVLLDDDEDASSELSR